MAWGPTPGSLGSRTTEVPLTVILLMHELTPSNFLPPLENYSVLPLASTPEVPYIEKKYATVVRTEMMS